MTKNTILFVGFSRTTIATYHQSIVPWRKKEKTPSDQSNLERNLGWNKRITNPVLHSQTKYIYWNLTLELASDFNFFVKEI